MCPVLMCVCPLERILVVTMGLWLHCLVPRIRLRRGWACLRRAFQQPVDQSNA